MNREQTVTAIQDLGAVAVIRAESEEKAFSLIEQCAEGGLSNIELTFTVPFAHRVIEHAAMRYGKEILLGAGSVLDSEKMCIRDSVLSGKMSVVGTRPEVRRYVEQYTDEMMATLLLPPGMLSNASVKYKEESRLLSSKDDPERVYLEQILPDKMRFNLDYLPRAGVMEDLKVIGRSIACMFKKESST